MNHLTIEDHQQKAGAEIWTLYELLSDQLWINFRTNFKSISVEQFNRWSQKTYFQRSWKWHLEIWRSIFTTSISTTSFGSYSKAILLQFQRWECKKNPCDFLAIKAVENIQFNIRILLTLMGNPNWAMIESNFRHRSSRLAFPFSMPAWFVKNTILAFLSASSFNFLGTLSESHFQSSESEIMTLSNYFFRFSIISHNVHLTPNSFHPT